MFYKIETQTVHTIRQLKKAHAVSHPQGQPTDEWLAENGYARIEGNENEPDYNPDTQVLVSTDMVALIGGVYKFTYTVRYKTQEELKSDVIAQINTLEAQITPRRLREAVLTPEGKSWLATIENAIEALREKLN